MGGGGGKWFGGRRWVDRQVGGWVHTERTKVAVLGQGGVEPTLSTRDLDEGSDGGGGVALHVEEVDSPRVQGGLVVAQGPHHHIRHAVPVHVVNARHSRTKVVHGLQPGVEPAQARGHFPPANHRRVDLFAEWGGWVRKHRNHIWTG